MYVLPVARFEVRLIPTTALEPEGGRRHFLPQLSLAALRTVDKRWFADFLNGFELVLTRLTLVFVDRHLGFRSCNSLEAAKDN